MEKIKKKKKKWHHLRDLWAVKLWMQGIESGKEVITVLLGLELERMGLRLGSP